MRMADLIEKKKQGAALTNTEISEIISGYVNGAIPDYQMSALLMAICFRGMNSEETLSLTMAITRSGHIAEFKGVSRPIADKHSTGGVGDTTTLLVVPIVAACGVKMAKMSGRGLGHTGGTLDKLESIPGFRCDLPEETFLRILETVGCAVVSQNKNLAPADKLLYALRDVTATVDSLPLIASSIMGKKLALSCDTLVLDVKTGTGAFMQSPADAFALAQAMVKIGLMANRSTVALITDMNQPLGNQIGNALEVMEAAELLQNPNPNSALLQVSLMLAAEILLESGRAPSRDIAQTMAQAALESGAAWQKLLEMVDAQGGSTAFLEQGGYSPPARHSFAVKAKQSGVLIKSDPRAIGHAAQLLGAGRATLADKTDPRSGILLQARLGDDIKADEPLAILWYNDESKLQSALSALEQAFSIGEAAPAFPLCYGKVDKDGTHYFKKI